MEVRPGWLTWKTSGWCKEVGHLQAHAWKLSGASEVARMAQCYYGKLGSCSYLHRGWAGTGSLARKEVGQAGNHWTGSFEGACGPRFSVGGGIPLFSLFIEVLLLLLTHLCSRGHMAPGS